MSRYYYDYRIEKLVNEKSINIDFLAPEMYFEYLEGGKLDIFTETWYVGDDKYIYFSYSSWDINEDNIEMKRKHYFDKYKVKGIDLISFKVPNWVFKENIRRLEELDDRH